MSAPTVLKEFPLKDSTSVIRVECHPDRRRGVWLMWVLEDDQMEVGPHVFPLDLVRSLADDGYAQLTLLCATFGLAVCPDVRADVERQTQRAREADLAGWKDEW